ncbi:CBS domain-containing protein [bacterium]|nr:CBS domain-containing protein [bacterium]
MTLVQDIMTKDCYCMRAEQPLTEAILQMDQRSISGGPVIDPSGLVVGHLSRTGISRHLARMTKTAGELLVADVMENFAFQVYPDDSVKSLLETMLASRIHRMIVTDEEGRPIGIVTSMDLMTHLYDLLRAQD